MTVVTLTRPKPGLTTKAKRPTSGQSDAGEVVAAEWVGGSNVSCGHYLLCMIWGLF